MWYLAVSAGGEAGPPLEMAGDAAAAVAAGVASGEATVAAAAGVGAGLLAWVASVVLRLASQMSK